ncbi:replication protein A 70 kDa DNA-binding subunit B-like [Coffea arabica]|uniref:Replication protein A 70 kDa DNA-binding subunit B-like n=1 Tax=Coffea arabica TaxID=13443 RepID=A0A6P6V014_COFAR|nr:replication protein A 70 kDa DNA-binding subunit B-like [Coffea arabica]
MPITTDCCQAHKVEALIYGPDIEFFKNHFAVYQRYFISNANVQEVQQPYHSQKRQNFWTIANSTVVERLEEQEPQTIPDIYTFANFTDMYQHVDSNTKIDIIAVVIHAYPRNIRATTTTRDIVVIDQSCILINPPIPQTAELNTWCQQNQDAIFQMVHNKSYEDRNKLLPPPVDNTVITIQTLLMTDEKKAFWVSGIPKLVDTNQRLWYTACPTCNKYLKSKPNWAIPCTSCNKRIHVVTRCRMTVELSDHTSTITLDINGLDGEQLLPFSLAELQRQEAQLLLICPKLVHSAMSIMRGYKKLSKTTGSSAW